MTTAAVILAAGGSSRFGGDVNKLVAHFRGRPLVSWAIDHAAEAGLDDLIVVMGAVDVAALASSPARVVPNDAWSHGQATSLQVAIGWAADWLVVLLVAQILHAATFGSFHAAAVATVHRVFPPQAQARGQSLFSSIGYGAGGALGAVAAGWAWEAAGPGAAFSVSSVAAAAGLLFAYPLRRKGL